MGEIRDTKKVKATEQHFPLVLFMLLSKVGQTFESVNEILNCDQMNSNEQNFPLTMSDFQFILCRFFAVQSNLIPEEVKGSLTTDAFQCFSLHSIDVGDNFESWSELHVHGDHHVFLSQKHQRLSVNFL